MPYVASVERIGIEKGRQEGILGVCLSSAEKKYSLAGEDVSVFMSGLTPEQLEVLGGVLLDAENVPGIHS